MKKVAIVQSNYIPWKGYFDLINIVDEFILFDDVQFTRRDWRNRNKIKTANGLIWLTIPVQVKGKFKQTILETKVIDNSWVETHWKSLVFNYGKAPYFNEVKESIHAIYEQCLNEEYLSKVNYCFIKGIADILGIKTKISWSSDYEIIDGKTERLVHLCSQAGASTYISGPSAKIYLNCDLFQAEGIDVQWMEYDGYPEYPQLHSPPFEHYVSILDLLFNVGLGRVKKSMLSY